MKMHRVYAATFLTNGLTLLTNGLTLLTNSTHALYTLGLFIEFGNLMN